MWISHAGRLTEWYRADALLSRRLRPANKPVTCSMHVRQLTVEAARRISRAAENNVDTPARPHLYCSCKGLSSRGVLGSQRQSRTGHTTKPPTKQLDPASAKFCPTLSFRRRGPSEVVEQAQVQAVQPLEAAQALGSNDGRLLSTLRTTD